MASRALVLGGGGVTGVAWEIGLLAGLAEGGLELADADLVVGTSAGAVVGAQVTSGLPLPELYARQLAGYGGELAARLSRRTVATMGWAAVRSREPRTARARIGRLALSTPTVPEAQRRAVIESRLPVHEWPSARLRVTAVDAESGAFAVFDRDAGVPLVDAVAASCAVPGVWPPVTIDGRRWIDGGMRSSANADLAEGYQRVVVLAPVSGGFGPIARLGDQVSALRDGGAQVTVVTPDRDSRRAIGRNMLDPARRAVAARAGHAQAPAAAAEIRDTWS
jgi:NTE family protein